MVPPTPSRRIFNNPPVTRLGSTGGHYQYRPLKPGEIRILKLHLPTSPKSKHADVISGKIIHVSVNNLPKYEALSYAWGNEDANESIIIDGKSLAIRSNLAAALRQFRQDFTTCAISPQPSWHRLLPRRMRNYRRIWIDAICINQGDVDERNQQIQLMCHIYTHCNRLVVWLGPTCEDGQIAADFLELLAQRTEDDDDNLKAWAAKLLASASFIHTYIAVLRVFSSPWFGRAWIFQEYILGAKGIALFQYGGHQISEEAVMAANNVLFDLEFCNLPAWRQGPEVVDILENSEWDTLQYRLISQWSDIRAATIFSGVIALKERFPLLYYLNHIRQSTSTDPRDKVYATLGMLGFHHGPSGVPVIQLGELIVDYDTPVQNVYSSVVAEIILQTKRLNVLLACSETGPLVNRTWTPDWNTEYKSGFLVYDCGEFDVQDLDDPGGFQSSAQMDCVASFSADRPISTVAGLHWATVKTISPSSDFSSTEQSLSEESSADTGCTNTLLQYCENCWVMLKSGTTSRSEADAFKALWKTLLVDYHGGIDVDWTETAFTSAKNILLQVGVTVSNESITVKDFDIALDAMWRTCQKTSAWSNPVLLAALKEELGYGDHIVITAEGFIGKVFSEDIQAGDIVCVILGCQAPLLLLPVGTQFELLGGVYLDGIMFGEAIEAMERGEVELKDFELI